MTAKDFQDLLKEAIENFEGWDEEGMVTPRVETYGEAGILSGNKGLVVRFPGNGMGFKGEEFQVALNGTYGGDEEDA